MDHWGTKRSALGEQSHDERARDLVCSVSQLIHRHVPLG
jgi:hypothetical protein